MKRSYWFTIFAIWLSFVLSSGKVPHIDPNEYPVPGKPLLLLPRNQTIVTAYEYNYRPRGYTIKTRWSDGRFHRANGTLVTQNSTSFYTEVGQYAETLEDDKSYYVEYIIDENGYQELTRNETVLSVPRVSPRAIGSILG